MVRRHNVVNTGARNANKAHSPIRRGSRKVGWEAAVVKSHINCLILFERTIEQTTETMALALKQ